MNKFRLILCGVLLAFTVNVLGQGAHNIVISEVLTNNTASILDEYGQHKAWIELENTSFSKYDVRGMYLTTDRSVLDKSMSVPERIKRMSLIPSGESRTSIAGRKHLVLFLNSHPEQGKLHLALQVPMSEPLWIALYNGNARELIDSVSIPALAANQSYARANSLHGKKARWSVKGEDSVTPGIENFIETSETKVEKFKREDPHGFAMAIMAMGIVFFCLALLWIFFTIFGMIMRHAETAKKAADYQPIKAGVKTVEKTIELGHKTGVLMQDGLKTRGIDKEIYMAVIAMAIKQYQEDVHDIESGVITIRQKDTGWDDEYSQMTQYHDPFMPTEHTAPRIPTTPELH